MQGHKDTHFVDTTMSIGETRDTDIDLHWLTMTTPDVYCITYDGSIGLPQACYNNDCSCSCCTTLLLSTLALCCCALWTGVGFKTKW